MNILALNTAFSNSDVALLIDDKKDYISLDSSAKQSENILVCTHKLLEQNNAKVQDIQVMSVVVGPGSFTGIRIGVGLVKGMHLAKKDIKLISVCSLDLMAYIYAKQQPNSNYCCVIDALSGNLFVCEYKNGQRVSEPTMLTDTEELIGKTVVGLKNEYLDFCTVKVEFSPEMLLEYTIEQCNKGNFVEESNLLPIYLRKSQAEIGLENENKKN
ncbi:MAG: tRNA (adenosine(37)-N6)-threonylcarbamoyltransferase complex dimerization subunit type 1 TsaB [Clostridia bacterium]|nr:tRNA (adenosine(37)-N6)-threonylcarbamoyltransferase complex dimerization subunit type 1 TsaB [Clostridia bacterium]